MRMAIRRPVVRARSVRTTPAITGGKKLQSEERAAQLFDVRVNGFVYARHGHELMG